jgi:DNA-binding NtrC family response regulator
MADSAPALLIVEGLRDRSRALERCLREHDGGRLADEFELVQLDCFEALRDWYALNPGRFVSIILQGVDFTGVKDESKLVGYPQLKYPVPKDFDPCAYQGLVIYALLRETGIDPLVPVLFVSHAPDTPQAQRFYSFMLYPAQGVCQFVHVPPGPDGLGVIARRADAAAMRPLDDERRAHWRRTHRMVLGRSRKMVYLGHEIERLGPADSVVLLLGKPGVGKELAANALHRCSRRFVAGDPLREYPTAVNIAALDRNLIESELFGHVRGAFTGSVADREGVFESGSGSTVFLDEIGEIGNEVQLKLLRTIENHRVKRVGGSHEIPVEMRLVAATNRTIDELVLSFRPDFYSRVVQQCLPIPSLVERWQDENPAVVEADLREIFEFVVENKNSGPHGPRPLAVDDGAIRFLHQLVAEYVNGENDVFGGNVRTLRAALEQAWERAQYDGSATVSVGHIISTVGVLRFMSRRDAPPERRQTLERVVGSLSMKAIEKRAIIEALERCENNITRTADLLGVHRDTLRRRISDYGL